MAKQLRSYFDFRGGLNTDAAIDNLADNELMQADNVDLLERGGITKRKGTIRLNSVSYNAPVEQLIDWPRESGAVELLAIVGDKLCSVDESDWTIKDITTVAGRRVRHFVFQDRFYFVDGEKFRVYDGEQVSVVQPSEAAEGNIDHIHRCRFLLRHPNSFRFFAAGDSEAVNAVYFSEPNDPGGWKTTSVLFPATAEGPVTGLALFGDALLVFYPRSVWAWRGLDPEADATWYRLPTGVGTSAPESIALTPGTLTFLADDGLYTISPAILGYNVTLEPVTEMVHNIAANRVQKLIRQIEDPEKAVGLYDSINSRYLLAYTEPGDQRNTKILVYDWSVGAFTVYTGLQVNDFLLRRGGAVYIATHGYIVQMNVGHSDSGAPILMTARTKQFNLDYPFHKKRILRLYMSFKQPEQGTSLVSMRLYVDGTLENEIKHSQVYDNFVWGDSEWGAIWGFRDQVTTRSAISASGHRVQVEFVNEQADVPTTVYGLAFEYRPVRAKGMRL